MAEKAERTSLDNRLTVTDYRNRLEDERNRNFLKDVMEYVYGLNDELVSLGVLSEQEEDIINCLIRKVSRQQLNDELIAILLRHGDAVRYERFMRSLCTSYQWHLELYIRIDGKFSDDEEDRPLSEQERLKFRSFRTVFVDLLSKDISKHLDVIISKCCISNRHYHRISEEQYTDEKVRKLLEIIQSRCLKNYQDFLMLLEDFSPAFKCADMMGDSGYVAFDAYVESKTASLNKSEVEEKIIQQYNKDFKDHQCNRILKNLALLLKDRNLGLAFMKKSSIRTYVRCNFGSLQSLYNATQSGEMRTFLQLLFNDILQSSEIVTVSHVFMYDYSFQEFSFQFANAVDSKSKEKLLRNGEEIIKNFNKYPFEKVLGRILFCAYVSKVAISRKITSCPEQEAFVQLSNICQNWWTMSKRTAVRTSLQRRLKRPDGRIELKLENTIPFQDRVVCATQMNDAIYVVTSRERNALHQYSAKSRVYQDKFIVAENIQISSMEASETENGIFCIDETDGAVWFWFWTKGQQPGKATVMKQFSPSRCITVSPKDHLKILLSEKHNVIEIKEQHSEIIRTLQLPDHIEKPLWLVRNKGGYILVSHGSNTGNRHRICMINRHGSVVLTYGCKRGNGPEELNRPCCMALDQEDRVFVADTSNHRVVVLDSKMNLINVVLDEKNDGINSPSSLHYARDSKQLFVTRDKFVDIYKVKVIDGSSPDVPNI